MTWTYAGDPSAVERDWVRFYVGDTDTTDQQLTDEEIAALISEEGSKEAAVVAASLALASKYARRADKAVGDLRINYSQLQDHYRNQAESLRKKYLGRKAVPKAGGISVSRKETVELDTDRVRPWAARDQFRHEGSEDDDDPSY